MIIKDDLNFWTITPPEACKAIILHLCGQPLDNAAAPFFELYKNLRKKYSVSEKSKVAAKSNGKKGGRQKVNAEPTAKKVSEKRFVPPTVAEVQDYTNGREVKISAEQFVNFYTSKNWKVGSQKMKDWRAAVRTWEQRVKEKMQEKEPQKVDYNTSF